MEQRICVYTHPELNIFYAGCYNADIYKNSGSLKRNYHRAKYVKDNILAGKDVNTLSGFMIALINTDFTGWTEEVVEEVFPDAPSATLGKALIIEEREAAGLTFIGSSRTFVKGQPKKNSPFHGFNRKLNINNMKIEKVAAVTNLVVRSMANLEPTPAMRTAVYNAMTSPDRYGPRMKNYGSYQVDCIGNLFRFIRNYLGFDLGETVPAAA